MYHEWNIVWQYMYWYSTIVSLMMIPIIQCTQIYCTCTCTFNILICSYHKTCWKLEHKSTCYVMCYIFNKDYFCQKKFTEENIFFRPIDYCSRNINNHFFLKLLLQYNAEHVQRFFKSWFCTERKRLILHVFLNGKCELMAIL